MNRLMLAAIAALVLGACARQKTDNSEQVNIVPDSVYISEGNQLVSITFDTLRNSLLAAIGAHGFPYAISFCNEHAQPLTELFEEKGISVRRAALRYRNPLNELDSLEKAVFSEFETNGPSTRLIRTNGEVHFIKPIMMQAMCLNCHGTPGEHIQAETMAAIQGKYPHDQATGFADSDLRGIWHVVFPAKP